MNAPEAPINGTLTADELKQPEYYLNRELSQLEFNRRVLYQAIDESIPLLERMNYLCIASTNMDEYFEVRVAGLKQKVAMGSVQAGPDNMSPQRVLNAISQSCRELVDEQYRILNDILIPALEQQDIHLIRRGDWSNKQVQWLSTFFETEVLPILSPLGLDTSHTFPRILNKSLNFIVSLKGKDAFGRNSGLAVVQAPRSLSRIIQLPEQECECGPHDFVFLSSIIHEHIEKLFPGMKVTGNYQFRVTRNSDLFVDEEEVDDLLRALEGELPSRRYGDAVRLEVADNCPEDIANSLLTIFELNKIDMYQVNGPVNLNRLAAICEMVNKPKLKFPSFTPSLPNQLTHGANIFKVLRKQDILLHHPFQSFAPVIEFLRQAASDEKVLAIKQTLYRTGSESAMVNALVKAARAGKAVTVVIELRARFDEEDNIVLANRLQEAGAHVVYGIVGFKTHAKMTLVVRRDEKKLRHYVHLGTGNYHARTARLYTDYGLFTSEKNIGEDVHKIFMQMTSFGKVSKLNSLLQAPFSLHQALLDNIQNEIDNAIAGKPSRIIIKVNSLVEPQIIQSLYRASNVGVKIDLIVRGMCCLKPGIKNISENIQVRSIIGRFLEHTRVFYFENNKLPEVYCASADWMERNFFRRVEVCYPITNKTLKEQIIQDLHFYLKDNTQTSVLQKDGTYVHLEPKEGEEVFCAQLEILKTLAENS
ncbi:MAG: polyphosphate kinase 1 [Gammaproteobacteria bacterium]|nr:MAG: polyphosphate kinase 1 [Gammaproteobacteria bacterium]